MTQVPADRDYDLFIYKDGYWAEHDAFYLSYGDHYVLEIGIAPLNMAARVYGSVTDANNGDIIRGAEAVLHCGDSEDWIILVRLVPIGLFLLSRLCEMEC